ncbi:MAG: hypothetical protein ACOZIN_14880 [Myxococcota bacterium]
MNRVVTTRITVLCLCAVALSACFDFDAAYQGYCSGGRCDALADGGGGDGGGDSKSDGGDLGNDAGSVEDAGPREDGGATDAGTSDAGCPSFLCPVDAVELSRASYMYSYWSVAPGIVAESVDRYQVYTSYDIDPLSAIADYDLFEYTKVDGGLTEVNRSFEFGDAYEAKISKGTLADRWTGTRGYIRHYVQDFSVAGFGDCQKPDGGQSNSWFYGLEVFSPTDVLFVGYPFTICRWTPTGGLVELADPQLGPSVYLNDAHRTASGVEYVVGGDYNGNDALGKIYRSNGAPVSGPVDVDSFGDGWMEIDGVGNEAWVVSHSGMVAQLRPDGGFEQVFDAGFGLRSVSARSVSEVWAVGHQGSRAAYFDGGTWGLVVLPSSASNPSIVWERVKTTEDGLVLSGYLRTGSPAALKGVVHSYRRFGK